MKPLSIICLAAGHNERFGGRPKQTLEVKGETLEARTKRLFPGVEYVTRDIVPNSTCMSDTLKMCREKFGNVTIVLLADVYYTKLVSRDIISWETTLTFWSDRQDIFAIKFHQCWADGLVRSCTTAVQKKKNNGRLWEAYRAVLGLPSNLTVPHGDMLIRLVADSTQDFDEPQKYDNFIAGISKNKILSSARLNKSPTSR